MLTHHMLLHVDHCVPCQSISKLDLRKELRNVCVCVCANDGQERVEQAVWYYTD